jgi:hypothetical protein
LGLVENCTANEVAVEGTVKVIDAGVQLELLVIKPVEGFTFTPDVAVTPVPALTRFESVPVEYLTNT